MHGIRYITHTHMLYTQLNESIIGIMIFFWLFRSQHHLALVHDLAESIVGDITPYCGVSKEEKQRREMDAMQEITKLIAPRGERLMELFEVKL